MFSVPSWALTPLAKFMRSSAVLMRTLVSLALSKKIGRSTVTLSRSVAIRMRCPDSKVLPNDTDTSFAVLSRDAVTDFASAIATIALSALLPVTSYPILRTCPRFEIVRFNADDTLRFNEFCTGIVSEVPFPRVTERLPSASVAMLLNMAVFPSLASTGTPFSLRMRSPSTVQKPCSSTEMTGVFPAAGTGLPSTVMSLVSPPVVTVQ